MAELRPHPFARLVRRMLSELEARRAVFDLPESAFVRGRTGLDTSVTFHGHRAATPLGPAAGPHSQLAQNLVLSYLGGGRIMELKTVQILDELQIPRPCIDMQTVGYNVEWSQELALEDSLEEYVKASMLIDILNASGALGLRPDFERVVYDMSVGYDLAGIRSQPVQDFIRGMRDATPIVARLRDQLSGEDARYRDLDFRTKLSDTLTLSTFHGCPPDEIEGIIDFLLREHGLHCVIKLNPTLLGAERVRGLLNDALGYPDRVPGEAFDKDTQWDQAVGLVGRLRETARSLGLGLGVKLTNTLIVENTRDFFPSSEEVMYLSGRPLHVLAMHLVRDVRRAFGDTLPISFSAGIDRENFADAVALGLVPVTVCSDLLRAGGYARMAKYFEALHQRMDDVGARDIEEHILRGRGHATDALSGLGLEAGRAQACREALSARGDLRAAAGDAFERWLGATKLLNTESYVEGLAHDPRYGHASLKAPRKVGSHLVLFDCLTCDKCVPVCPNDANFTFALPAGEVPRETLRPDGRGGFVRERGEPLVITKKHQIGCFADFCNECGNCDVFCPEDGGPYAVKPLFFGSEADFDRFSSRGGFYLRRDAAGDRVRGRLGGSTYTLRVEAGWATFEGEGFALRFAGPDLGGEVSGEAREAVDLAPMHIMDAIRRGILDGDAVTWIDAGRGREEA